MKDKFLGSGSFSGFTLLEVMIAVAILSMALVAALGSQSQSVSLATEAKFTTRASLLLSDLAADWEKKEESEIYAQSGVFEDFPDYRWQAEVTNPSLETLGDAAKYIKKIVLVVGRNDTDRYQYRLEFYRFVSEAR
jgi:general secretion pathway protein I